MFQEEFFLQKTLYLNVRKESILLFPQKLEQLNQVSQNWSNCKCVYEFTFKA